MPLLVLHLHPLEVTRGSIDIGLVAGLDDLPADFDR
jgi:hypothetical protein